MLKVKGLFLLSLIALGVAYMLWPEPDRVPVNQTELEHGTGMTEAQRHKVSQDPIRMAKEAAKRQQAEKLRPKSATKVTLSEQELRERSLLAEEKKTQISVLMSKYNDSRLSAEEGHQLKAEMKLLMEEYNQVILPVALKAMEEREQG